MGLAAAGAAALACAGPPAAATAPEEYRPVARSTLVSNPGVGHVVAHTQQGPVLTTVLARLQQGRAPHPVARVLQTRTGAGLQVSVQRLPVPEGVAAAEDDEQASIEQIYAHVMRQEPVARYCLGGIAPPCDPGISGVSHAQVLRELARERERMAVRAAAVPWRVVEIESVPTPLWDADVVGARLAVREAPMEGVAVYFNRAPHSTCVARTGADGVARCRLVDQHGDEHQHDHLAPVVATYPGDVRADRVLLPTTFVLPASVAPGMPGAWQRRP